MTLHDTIRSFVVDNFLFGEDRGLSVDSSFLQEGIVDSTGILELVAFLEAEFGLRVADDELVPDNLDSIRKVAAYLEKKQGVVPLMISPSLVNA